jgi:hypothetical protein
VKSLKRKLCCFCVACSVVTWAVAAGQRKIVLLPRLQNGERLVYESHARIDRHVETKSNVATVLRPSELRRDFSTKLQLLVQEARIIDNRLFLSAESELESAGMPPEPATTSKLPKVTFTIGRDGAVTSAEGLDELDAEKRLAWQFWVAQFAFGWTLPSSGVRFGEKWKSEEPEKTPAPIGNLVWERETTYVEDEPCPARNSEKCAVFLVSSTLRQRSSPKDSTPEEYRIRQLKTSGTAKGNNETVVYVSLQTGLLVRATEDSEQYMTVTIAKADDSNQVHYDMQVKSHFETLLSPQTVAK